METSRMSTSRAYGEPQFARLEARRRSEFHARRDNLTLRLRRCVSWLGRAERELFEHRPPDPDAAFVFYWIAFNATYAEDSAHPDGTTEREKFNAYFGNVVKLDDRRLIYNAIWNRFSKEVRSCLENPFMYEPFWKHYNGIEGHADWKDRFEREKRRTHRALGRMDTVAILRAMFDRMYVLRNQIVHGGATHQGSVNRRQVQDGARIMAFLSPLFVDLMMDNPEREWGRPYYPVVPE